MAKALQPLLPFGRLPMFVGGNAVTDIHGNRRTHEVIEVSDRRRNDGRHHDTGLIRPYRPCPADFRERFLEMGQSKEIEDHYRTNWRCIARWIDECGGDALRAERRAVTGSAPKPSLRRARRYVMGMTITGRQK